MLIDVSCFNLILLDRKVMNISFKKRILFDNSDDFFFFLSLPSEKGKFLSDTMSYQV